MNYCSLNQTIIQKYMTLIVTRNPAVPPHFQSSSSFCTVQLHPKKIFHLIHEFQNIFQVTKVHWQEKPTGSDKRLCRFSAQRRYAGEEWAELEDSLKICSGVSYMYLNIKINLSNRFHFNLFFILPERWSNISTAFGLKTTKRTAFGGCFR